MFDRNPSEVNVTIGGETRISDNIQDGLGG